MAVLALLVAACGTAVDTPSPVSTTGSSPSPATSSGASPSASPPAASVGPSSGASPSPSASLSAPACPEKRGKIVDRSYSSKVAGTTVRYRVYLPPCYAQSKRRYPLLILFHGSDRDQTEWTDILRVDRVLESGIAAGRLPPMVIVMPGGGELANTRIFTRSRSFEGVVLDEILPAVEHRYCTLGTRAGRAIGGISRGGFWAFLIAFRHPGLFSAVGGHSPFFDPGNAPVAYNPLDLAQSVVFAPGKQPRIWVDAGAQDYAMPGITRFVDALEKRGIDPGFHLYPTGHHDIAYWKSHVSTYLAFYGRAWPRSVEELPVCRP